VGIRDSNLLVWDTDRHTVDQEQTLLLLVHGSLHGVLEQLNGHLHGHDSSLFDVRLDHLAELATRSVLLFA